GGDRERVHRGSRRVVSARADRNRARAVHHHVDCQFAVAAPHLGSGARRTTGRGCASRSRAGRRMTSLRWRQLVSSIFVGFCGAAVLLALIPLAMILFFVISEGIQSLNVAFFTNMPKPVGESGGGMANAIVGTLMVTGLGSLFAVPIGILSGVYMSEYAGTRFAAIARFAADTLNGVPSIVIGVFAYGIAVLPFKQFSAMAGGFALGVMMI